MRCNRVPGILQFYPKIVFPDLDFIAINLTLI